MSSEQYLLTFKANTYLENLLTNQRIGKSLLELSTRNGSVNFLSFK